MRIFYCFINDFLSFELIRQEIQKIKTHKARIIME